MKHIISCWSNDKFPKANSMSLLHFLLSLLIFFLSLLSLCCVSLVESAHWNFLCMLLLLTFARWMKRRLFFPLCVWLCLSCLVFCGEFVPPSGHDDCDAGAFFKWKVVNFMRTLFDRKMWQLTAKEIRNKGGRGWTTNSDSDKNWHKQKFSSAVKPVYNVTNNFSLYFLLIRWNLLFCSLNTKKEHNQREEVMEIPPHTQEREYEEKSVINSLMKSL